MVVHTFILKRDHRQNFNENGIMLSDKILVTFSCYSNLRLWERQDPKDFPSLWFCRNISVLSKFTCWNACW